jgi:hypothetical protein
MQSAFDFLTQSAYIGPGDTAALVWNTNFPGPINDYLGSCPCAEPWFGVNGTHLRK